MALDRMGLSRGMTCSDSRIYLVPSALTTKHLSTVSTDGCPVKCNASYKKFCAWGKRKISN